MVFDSESAGGWNRSLRAAADGMMIRRLIQRAGQTRCSWRSWSRTARLRQPGSAIC
jgi:hypothetical protein